jgi:hypothetical protein
MAEVAAGGLSGPGMLAQLAIAYAVVTFVSGVLTTTLVMGFSWLYIAAAALGIFTGAISLVISAFALYFVAHLATKPPRFMDVLTGYTFVNIVAGVALVVLLVPGLLVSALGLASVEDLVALMGLGYMVLVLFYLVWYLVGLFDMGCIGSVVLGLVAVIVAGALERSLAGMIGAALG